MENKKNKNVMDNETMKGALSPQELKALCEFFYNEGYTRHISLTSSPAGRQARGERWADDFETTFNNLMQGKYNNAIEKESLKLKWEEMQAEIQNEMDKWDEEQRGKAGKVIEEMRKIFINC
jgi:hypothetical protein